MQIPKNLISAKIVRFEQDELGGTITMFAKSDFGDDFRVMFYERCGDVEMDVEREDSESVS